MMKERQGTNWYRSTVEVQIAVISQSVEFWENMAL